MLGFHYIDKITGFRGVCIGYCEYLTGCNQALLSPKVGPDGALRESQWFDIQRLQRDPQYNAYPPLRLDNGATPGCDRPAPKK